MGGGGAEEVVDGEAEGGLHGFHGGGGVSGERGGDAFAAEEFFLCRFGLRDFVGFFDAVAEEDDGVAGLELDFVDVVSGLFQHADGEAIGFEDLDLRTDAWARAHEEGAGVAGVGVAYAAVGGDFASEDGAVFLAFGAFN